MSFQSSWRTSVDYEREFVDGLSDGHRATDQKDAGHDKARSNAIVSKTRDGVHVVGQHDATFHGGPLEENRIIDPGQSYVERANRVEVSDAPGHATEDAPVEVLVANQSEHPPSPWPWHAPSARREGSAAEAATLQSSPARPWPPVRAGQDTCRSRPNAAGSS